MFAWFPLAISLLCAACLTSWGELPPLLGLYSAGQGKQEVPPAAKVSQEKHQGKTSCQGDTGMRRGELLLKVLVSLLLVFSKIRDTSQG